MALYVVRGSFHVIGDEPDGDSMRFVPDAPGILARLGIAARVSGNGSVQLRLDAIDALETHYSPSAGGGPQRHQPLGLAHAARDDLLATLGFTGVRHRRETVVAAVPAQSRGHVLTGFADTHGRPVALVYPGDPVEADGTPVTVDGARLRASANWRLLERGLAYPTYYSRLDPQSRALFTGAVRRARTAGLGLWPGDRTVTGVVVEGEEVLTDQAVVLPKLFRRLVDYLALSAPAVPAVLGGAGVSGVLGGAGVPGVLGTSGVSGGRGVSEVLGAHGSGGGIALGAGAPSMDGFSAFLAARADRVSVLGRPGVTTLDTLVEVIGQRVRLVCEPEELIFVEA